jgi:hypothetical protein
MTELSRFVKHLDSHFKNQNDNQKKMFCITLLTPGRAGRVIGKLLGLIHKLGREVSIADMLS